MLVAYDRTTVTATQRYGIAFASTDAKRKDDDMTFGDWIGLLLDVATAAGTLAAAYFAYYAAVTAYAALNSWKREYKSQRDYETAAKVRLAAYHVQGQFTDALTLVYYISERTKNRPIEADNYYYDLVMTFERKRQDTIEGCSSAAKEMKMAAIEARVHWMAQDIGYILKFDEVVQGMLNDIERYLHGIIVAAGPGFVSMAVDEVETKIRAYYDGYVPKDESGATTKRDWDVVTHLDAKLRQFMALAADGDDSPTPQALTGRYREPDAAASPTLNKGDNEAEGPPNPNPS